MNIDLLDYYFGNMMALIGLWGIIYFVFFLKPPKDGKKGIKNTLYIIRDYIGKFIIKLFIVYSIVSLLGFLINGIRDIPYIVNKEPETATIETLTGISSSSKSHLLYVRNLSTGEVMQIKVRKKPIYAGEIYYINYLPNTKWASLN